MCLFLGNLAVGLLQGVVVLHSVELVGVFSRDNDDAMVCVVERALQRLHVLALADTLEREALLLVPVPNDDLVAILTSLWEINGVG